jgi:hypothetical protein
MLEMEDGVELCLSALVCLVVLWLSAPALVFVFGFNGHLLAWVADAIVASQVMYFLFYFPLLYRQQ